MKYTVDTSAKSLEIHNPISVKELYELIDRLRKDYSDIDDYIIQFNNVLIQPGLAYPTISPDDTHRVPYRPPDIWYLSSNAQNK